MGNVIKIEWDDYPARQDKRRLRARPEYDAVRALKIGEAIKFPCTWNHSVRFGHELCAGKSGSQIAVRNDYPERYIEAVCRDKVVYVRRTANRAWSRMEE